MKPPVNARFRAGIVLLGAWVMLVATSCGYGREGEQSNSTTATPIGPMATPTVDIVQAREAFETGGELTFEEVAALKREIVGEFEALLNIRDHDLASKSHVEYYDRLEEFTAKLEKCTLKETIGWVTGWWQDYDKDYKDIPDRNWLRIFIHNPFSGFGKDMLTRAAATDVTDVFVPMMSAGYLTDNEIAEFKYGQRISFRGQLTLANRYISVKNVEYQLLKDDPEVPEPTDDELSDLTVMLDRTTCSFGTCPDYTLTVKADGTVTFEGREWTKTNGAVSSTVDKAKLVEVATEIKKADFFSLDNSYSYEATDLSTYTLTVVMGGQSKQVKSYATRPIRLHILMNRIDQIVNTEQWIGNDGYQRYP